MYNDVYLCKTSQTLNSYGASDRLQISTYVVCKVVNALQVTNINF